MLELMGLLLLFMIIAAIVAIETRDLLASVISVTAVGFGVIVAFFYMRAPDVAIVPIVVEVLVLVILIRATLRVGLKTFIGNRDFFGMMVTLAMLLVIFLATIRVFNDLPAFGEPVISKMVDAPSRVYIANGLKETGAANIVTAVLLDYRAYDTLGEATVLFTSIIGAIAIIRRKARKKPSEPEVGEWQE
jgi:multicomponent Na+:H+ antiporter subunit B